MKREERRKGTYVAVKFHKLTNDAIAQYCKKNDIPNCVAPSKLHTTILYSRKHVPNIVTMGELMFPIEGTPLKFEVWPTQPDEQGNKKNCLVLLYDCPALVKRHNYFMDYYDATYDYDKFHTHITFSYDIGDLDIKDLPKFDHPIFVAKEYSEDLNLNWADEESTKEK